MVWAGGRGGKGRLTKRREEEENCRKSSKGEKEPEKELQRKAWSKQKNDRGEWVRKEEKYKKILRNMNSKRKYEEGR